MKTKQGKVLLVLSITCSLLSACGAGRFFGPTITPGATSTPASTMTATRMPIPTETPLPTATFTPIPVWSPEYKAALIDTKEIIVRDVLPEAKNEFSHTKLFNLELITDESFNCESGSGGKYRFVGYKAFSTSKGGAGYHSDEAYQAVAKVIMWAIFESAVRAGYEPQQVITPENKYDAFTAFVSEMTEGKQVEIRAMLPNTTEEFSLQNVTLGLPATIRLIFVSANNYRFKSLARIDGIEIAWGTHIVPEDKILELYIGGEKSLYYVHSYNLSNRYAFSTWQAFGLNGRQAPYDFISRGNQAVSFGGLTGALDCKP